MSKEQAYAAMFAFLEQQFELSQSEELGSLLGSMALLPDGDPADPAVKAQWVRAAAAAMQGQAGADLKVIKR
ncbi:hypothetical protein [Methylibium rhizosphaerae]|uniref:hypothetical protein n=1 Tax=Methylibium rhizosphaerae TaxID=2570323 RepID=UPI00112E4FDB|nr:hypothetical protein [Methylibium rhizosphaerae]